MSQIAKSQQILNKMCPNGTGAKLHCTDAETLLEIAKFEGQIDALQRIKPSTSRTSLALSEALSKRDKLIEIAGYTKFV